MSGIFLRIELGGVLDRKHKVGPLFWILKSLFLETHRRAWPRGASRMRSDIKAEFCQLVDIGRF